LPQRVRWGESTAAVAPPALQLAAQPLAAEQAALQVQASELQVA